MYNGQISGSNRAVVCFVSCCLHFPLRFLVFSHMVSVNSKSYLKFKEVLRFAPMDTQTSIEIREQTIKLSNEG